VIGTTVIVRTQRNNAGDMVSVCRSVKEERVLTSAILQFLFVLRAHCLNYYRVESSCMLRVIFFV
jgi:hypothetical protein